MTDIQRGLASMACKCFDKKTKGSGIKLTLQNKQLAKELPRAITKKFKKRRVYASYKNAVWAAHLARCSSIKQIQQKI